MKKVYMGAAKKLNETAEALIKDFVQELNPEQKERLLVWSEQTIQIRNDSSKSKLQKAIEIRALERPRLVRLLLIKILRAIKNKTWTNQSWARRLGLVGFSAGLTFGGTGVGIATLGVGMGFPLFLLTAAGGVILGAVIEEIRKEISL